MSTFNGLIDEFPDIRVDHFHSTQTQPSSRPALAFFLSHVHTDHLRGLDAGAGPFIYCSPATRDILPRLAKRAQRLSLARGVLESRARTQTYRHLQKRLKPIPLDCPTELELAPGRRLRVTLLDANHCVGAVMFLFEGEGRAVLYSGDVRAEKWWIETLVAKPLLLPYVDGGASDPTGRSRLRRLDCVYLDTTFATADDRYADFPSKADGLKQLLDAVARYPNGTKFYFDAWTFGYEDVWRALSAFTGSQIHVDDYRYGLFLALSTGAAPKAPEAAGLVGFPCGNHWQPGCLTTDPAALIHSCEKGTGCEIWDQDFVRITPIVSQHQGVDLMETGCGGGLGDLDPRDELELPGVDAFERLLQLCSAELASGQDDLLARVCGILESATKRGAKAIKLGGSEDADGTTAAATEDRDESGRNLYYQPINTVLARLMSQTRHRDPTTTTASNEAEPAALQRPDGLPTRIHFPLSRHSSYRELCQLISVLRPKGIYPCTVDYENWTPPASMEALFGHLYDRYTAPLFRHDALMMRSRRRRRSHQSQEEAEVRPDAPRRQSITKDSARPRSQEREQARSSQQDEKRQEQHVLAEDHGGTENDLRVDGLDATTRVLAGSDAKSRALRRQEAYEAVLGVGGADWSDIELISVDGHQTKEELL